MAKKETDIEGGGGGYKKFRGVFVVLRFKVLCFVCFLL